MQPDLPPPYPPRCSPDVVAARVHAAEWARRVGILGSGDAWAEIWDERDFADFDFALFASSVHPDARGARLNLVACWYVWGWYLDDLIMERFKRPRDVPGARLFLSRLAEMRDPDRRAPRNPAERGLADLWDRTRAEPAWRDRLAAQVPNLFDDALWKIGNLITGVPEPADYLMMRRRSGGAHWAAQLSEYVLDLDLPAWLWEATPVIRLGEAFSDVVDLHNDIVSYRRETEYEQDVTNGVVVIRAFLGTGLPEAMRRTRELLEARLRLFERLAGVEVPAMLAERETSLVTVAEVGRYLQSLRDWLAGDYQWHRETARYQEDSWLRKVHPDRRGPSGLGTSAARLVTTSRPAVR